MGFCASTGRTSDVINIGGTKLSARRIEEMFEILEEVREAAACGVRDAAGMEQLWVAVVANGPVDSEALKAKARAHADIGENLSELFVLPELPRGDLGKVQKAEAEGAAAWPAQGTSVMQIVDAILFWANATPARPAIIQPHGVQTYRMLADAIMAAASHFARSELDPAKPVAVAIEDPARMLVASLGSVACRASASCRPRRGCCSICR